MPPARSGWRAVIEGRQPLMLRQGFRSQGAEARSWCDWTSVKADTRSTSGISFWLQDRNWYA
jgi:hypothetical protein